MNLLKNAIHWFEIPVRDIARAKAFYETILDIQLSEVRLPNGLKMAIFPVEEGTIGGALCEHEEYYHPGHQGPVLYINADPDLQSVLDRLKLLKATIIVPKRQISPDRGYMAVFEDVEGNRIALHSSG